MFSQLSSENDRLSSIAQTYLEKLPFLSTEECAKRIWAWAYDSVPKLKNGDIDWGGAAWCFAYDILDDGVPYSCVPRNGSLHYLLGWSVVAQEANLRSLLEFVEGRQKEWIKFKCLAELQ